MQNWDDVIKIARDCHTRAAWGRFFEQHGEALATINQSKPLSEIFRMLKADSQSLQYSPDIFGSLIKGCLSSWNLELGEEISEHALSIPSVRVTLPASQIFLENGQPQKARDIANRGLRLSGLSSVDMLQLDMVVCGSYAEENKHAKAIRILERIHSAVRNPELHPKESADFLLRMGRMHFFLGNYAEAGKLFYEASKSFRRLEDWESTARTIFNTAASYLNAGKIEEENAFNFVEEARQLAEEHNLPGPLAHCEALYGTNAYHHGNFAAAKEHLRKALEYLPISDKSYRRLHILSILAYTYLAMGRYHLARKFGRQTIDLAALDNSQRYKLRYDTLEAELHWEDGLVEESQQILKNSLSSVEKDGVHTLEELMSLSRYNLQSATLFDDRPLAKFKIADQLKRNKSNWADRQYSLGHLLLNQNKFSDASECFQNVRNESVESGDGYHEALGILGEMLSLLKQRKTDDTDPLIRKFEVVVGRLGETPLKTQIAFVQAARAYQRGQFSDCERILKSTTRYARQGFADKFCLNAAIATIEGKSSRLTSDWSMNMVARFTRTYFAPSFEALGDRHFLVSKHYTVSLERHPSLADLLNYLLLRGTFSADADEIQTEVWEQSLKAQGWQQKIRNTIMRLRDFFPYTIAPLILQTEQVGLFKDAIQVRPAKREGLNTDEEIARLLVTGSMTSSQLSRRLGISPSTTKRVLKRLVESNQIVPNKEGRNVFYAPGPDL